MSNTTSLGDKAICNQLSATQLGSVSKPVDTAYITNIIPHPSLSTPNLQNVTNEGNTTTNGIEVNDLTTTGVNGSGNAIQAGGNIVSDTGDIIATGGNLSAPSGFVTGTNVTATTGDVRAVAGDIEAIAGDVIANGDITATTGDITATAGDVNGVVVEASDEVKAQNDIISDTGDIKATNGSLTAGNLISAVGKITAGTSMTAGTAITAGTGMTCTTGSITCVAGNVSASRDTSGTTLTITNVDKATPTTTLAAPAAPNAVPPTHVFDMTNKSRGSYWLFTSTATSFDLVVETNIPRVAEACGILVDFCSAAPLSTGAPFVTSHVITPGNTSTEFIIEITCNAAPISTTPIRCNILLMRDA